MNPELRTDLAETHPCKVWEQRGIRSWCHSAAILQERPRAGIQRAILDPFCSSTPLNPHSAPLLSVPRRATPAWTVLQLLRGLLPAASHPFLSHPGPPKMLI